MKAKLQLFSLVSLISGSIACLGQTPATDQPVAQPVEAVETAAPVQLAAAQPAEAQPAAAAQPTAEAAQPAAAQPAAAQPAASTPVDRNPNELIPIIVMDDVGLIDAIRNLARTAGLNYVLDPKVPYGGVDPATGKTNAQPMISIRWENRTAQQALTALLNNYDLVIVEDDKTGISRIKVKDPAAKEPLFTRTIQLKFANPSNLVSVVQASLTDSRSKVMADFRSSQLVIVATEKEIKTLNDLMTNLDNAPKQVLIEARLMETSKNPQSLRGINWSGTLEGQNLAFGNNLQTAPVKSGDSVGAPLATSWPKLMLDTAKGFNPATAFLDADGVNAVLSYLNTDSETEVLSTPRAVTVDNETASLAVTRAEPIFKNTAGTQGSPGGSEVTYTNLGTILYVTPRISANNFVQLHVVPEVSSVGATRSKIVSGTVNQADAYDIRKIETRVLIPSGNTLVLGGLVSSATQNGNTKVPIFGDLPLIGRAFRSEGKSTLRKNLMVFITPTIVQDSDFAPTQTDFLKSKPVESKEEQVTTYRSARPYDWSQWGQLGDPEAGQWQKK